MQNSIRIQETEKTHSSFKHNKMPRWFVNVQLNPSLNGNIENSSPCAFKNLLCVSLDSAARLRWGIPHLSPLRFSKCLSASCSTYSIGQHYITLSEKVAKQAGCLLLLLIIYFRQM